MTIKKPEDLDWIEGSIPEPSTDYMGSWAMVWIANSKTDELATIKAVHPWGDALNPTRWNDLMGFHGEDYYIKYYAWIKKTEKCEHEYIVAGGPPPPDWPERTYWATNLRVECKKCKAHFRKLPDIKKITNIPHYDCPLDCDHTHDIFHPDHDLDFFGYICLNCGRLKPERKPTDEEMAEMLGIKKKK